MGHHEHRAKAAVRAGCAVVTVSDTRTESDDRSGAAIRDALVRAGHDIVLYQIVPDDRDRISATVRTLAFREEIDAIVLTGGTGVAPRDVTYEALQPLLDRTLDGFGELFRMLSYEQVGAAAMLSRAVAGMVGTTLVFALPGSTAGCTLAVEKLILPELGHAVSLANPGREPRP
jgi:molybdenum cofactor biosynthesis protein B